MSDSNKTTVGIVGGAGYTGGELLRIAACHPELKIDFIHSRTYANQAVHSVHTDLIGLLPKTMFTDQINSNVNVVFLCVGHCQAKVFLEENPFSANTMVIDLSQDHRLNNQDGFVYGLSEANKKDIINARNIANPGCFATAIQLALFPLAQSKNLKSEVHITAVTGSTGAGYKPSPTTHFTWRSSNLSVYKAFEHQHLKEINQQFGQYGWKGEINMIPLRGNMTRGIIASCHFKSQLSEEKAEHILKEVYEASPFVFVVDNEPDVKSVVNTNNCLISVKKHGSNLHIVSVIDNLIKGASGQAIQNLNLMKGWDESLGLKLKPVAF
jgi:N-acetyl-gamma-glutamyl-phosphate reductase